MDSPDDRIREIRHQAERRQAALRLKRAGKTLEEIGAALGVTRQRAQQMVAKAEKEAGQ